MNQFDTVVNYDMCKNLNDYNKGLCVNKYYVVWSCTLEVSLGWSDILSTFGHLAEILSNISLYGTNLLKFHLFPNKERTNLLKMITIIILNY